MKQNSIFTFTICTPTYNRAQLLARAYASLLSQTFQDFEWIVVDDGSEDGTEGLVASWASAAPFPICYIRQEHQGKHVAVNQGIQAARGHFFIILDSDDWLLNDALERLTSHWDNIPLDLRKSFAIIMGLNAFESGRVVGNRFPSDILDSNVIEVADRYRVRGDKFMCFRTAVLRQYPFPEGIGEYVTEALVWNRIARRYRCRCINEVFQIVDYQRNGLSARITEMRVRSWKAAVLYYREAALVELPVSWRWRWRNAINYVRFALHGGMSSREQLNGLRRVILWLVSLLPGWLLYRRDLWSLSVRESAGQ